MLKLTGRRPTNLGVRDGKLAACPNKPNCVNSQGVGNHMIPPFELSGDAETSMKKLLEVVRAMPRTHVVENKPDYLYAEFSTRLLGFVDDVEFYCDGKVIHVRSASRLGYSDLGVNRGRVEEIRQAYLRSR